MPLSLVACAVLIAYVLRQDPELTWVRRWPGVLATGLLTLALAGYVGWQIRQMVSGSRVRVRNFYGGLRVRDNGEPNSLEATRTLTHGTINHGKQFVECFYAYHTSLSPKDELWPKEKFEKYSPDDLYRDLFIDGPDDVAIVQSTYLKDFYKNGFNTQLRFNYRFVSVPRSGGLVAPYTTAPVPVKRSSAAVLRWRSGSMPWQPPRRGCPSSSMRPRARW